MANPITNRYDFIYIFDVRNGNPNGDPDAGNAPRTDPETGHGFVSDVCLKRKIRNFICLAKGAANGSPAEGYDIYVKEGSILQGRRKEKLELAGDSAKSIEARRKIMCDHFFDVRMFGGVLSTGTGEHMKLNCGQVRGPVQLTFATSADPIVPLEQSVTRMAVETEREAKDQEKRQEEGARTMGRKSIVPYALYCAHGYISPHFAAQTGFSEEDLGLLKQSLAMMFEHDRSAARGQMAPQVCIAFRHDSALGNAPAHKLFERVVVERTSPEKPPRSYADYKVTVDESNLPAGVTIERWL